MQTFIRCTHTYTRVYTINYFWPLQLSMMGVWLPESLGWLWLRSGPENAPPSLRPHPPPRGHGWPHSGERPEDESLREHCPDQHQGVPCPIKTNIKSMNYNIEVFSHTWCTLHPKERQWGLDSNGGHWTQRRGSKVWTVTVDTEPKGETVRSGQ